MEYNIRQYSMVKLISKDIKSTKEDVILGTGKIVLNYFLPDSMQTLDINGVKFNRLDVEDETDLVLNEQGLNQQVSFGVYISEEKFENFRKYINGLCKNW